MDDVDEQSSVGGPDEKALKQQLAKKDISKIES